MKPARKRRCSSGFVCLAAVVAAYGWSRAWEFALPQTVRTANMVASIGTRTRNQVTDASSNRLAIDAMSSFAMPAFGLAVASVGTILSVVRASKKQKRAGRVAAAAGAGGAIETFMVKGPVDVAKLAMKCASLAAYIDLQCVTFFSLGVTPEIIASVAGGSLGLHGACPVYIADVAGLVGFDDKEGTNVEMAEGSADAKDGGVVVVAFRGGGHEPSSVTDNEEAEFPEERALHMVVRNAGIPETQPPCGAVYGGIAKSCYKLQHSGDLVPVSQFSVSTPMAVLTSFKNNASGAVEAALEALPPVAKPPIAAGFFSSKSRNAEDSVDSIAFSGLNGVRLFGMFADTLGPPAGGAPIACVPELLEWTSILDPDPRPALQLDPDSSVMALYGK